jgi:hypothetical protein
MHGARGGAPEGKQNGNYRHGGRTKEIIEVWKLIKSLRRCLLLGVKRRELIRRDAASIALGDAVGRVFRFGSSLNRYVNIPFEG